MKNIILIIGLIISVSTASNGQNSLREYKNMVTQYQNKLMASDAEGLSKMFMKSGFALHQDGTTTEGQEQIKNYYSAVFEQATYKSVDITLTELKVLSPNVFYGRGTYQSDVFMKGVNETMKLAGHWSNIVEIKDGKMEISRHMSMVPQGN